MTARWLVATCACALAFTTPREADACGGTFCDGGPTAMPVEQTGETILFVLDDDAVEAHIQIQIDPETEADQFAWVIPVMALPEFAVGSQPLFERMLAFSAPTYGSTSWREDCWDDEGGGGGCTAAGEGDDGDSVTLDIGSSDGGPEVVEQRTVGAFEVTVLSGGTADEVSQWLVDNGYSTDDAATPILGEYLANGFMFVAVKLATNAEVSDVHPIVLRIPGNEPCVPITLTRIAAQEDLRLRVLFLADSRVVPDNYAHVVLNDLRLDWITQASNYDAIVTQAVDGAGGRAWVTEYAGTPSIIDTSELVGPLWNAEAFVGLPPKQAMLELESQLLRECLTEECVYLHPLVEGIVREFLIPPAGVDPEAFYACPICDTKTLVASTFDDVGFAEALQLRVIDPALHAEEIFARFEFFTRMYTTMSPQEMLLDPTFIENPDAGTQSRLEHMGRAASWCDGTRVFQLPDARLVAVVDSAMWPAFPGMPAYERVEQWGPAGAPMVIEDRRDEIDAALDDWNDENGGTRLPPSAGECYDSDGTIDSFGPDVVEPTPTEERNGCSCTSATAPTLFALALLLLGLRRRG